MAQRDPGQKPTNIRWLVFGLACGTSFLLYLHRYTWNLVGPEIEKELSLTNTQTQILFALFACTYAVGQIPSGVVVDRFGPHRFLSAIIFLWSLALSGITIASNIFVFGFWRLMFGATQAGCYPALNKVTRHWFPTRQRTMLQGWIATTFGRAGGAVSSIILGLLMVQLQLTWRTSLLVLGGMGVACACLFWMLFRDSPERDERVNEPELELIREGQPPAARTDPAVRYLSAGAAVRSGSLWFLIVEQVLDAGADAVFVSLMGKYFYQVHHLDTGPTSWLTSLPLWGGAAGGIAGGWLNDRLIRATGNRRWARSGVGFFGKAIATVLILAVVMQTNGMAAASFLTAGKFFNDWTQPTAWGTCTDLGGRFTATVFSIINTAGSVGAILMAIVFGMVLDWSTTKSVVGGVSVSTTDWNPLFYLLAAMFLACGVSWLFIDCTKPLDEEPENT